MEDKIRQYDLMYTLKGVQKRAKMFGLPTSGTKHEVIRRILTATGSMYGTLEQERELSIDSCLEDSLEQVKEWASKANLSTEGEKLEICRRLVNAKAFPFGIRALVQVSIPDLFLEEQVRRMAREGRTLKEVMEWVLENYGVDSKMFERIRKIYEEVTPPSYWQK